MCLKVCVPKHALSDDGDSASAEAAPVNSDASPMATVQAPCNAETPTASTADAGTDSTEAAPRPTATPVPSQATPGEISAARLLLQATCLLADSNLDFVSAQQLQMQLELSAFGAQSKQKKLASHVLKRLHELGYLGKPTRKGTVGHDLPPSWRCSPKPA